MSNPFATAAMLKEKYRCPPTQIVSLNQHVLYKPADFTEEEYKRRNQLAVMVIDGGLGICKRCGAGEIELETWVTCETYRARNK